MNVDLTNFELFKSFAEFQIGSTYVDLHNEFNCNSITFSSLEKQLILAFESNEHHSDNIRHLKVIFDDCGLESYVAKLEKLTTDAQTIDTMYRRRFQSGNSLSEKSNGRYYYYINFFPDTSIEVFARSVTAIIE